MLMNMSTKAFHVETGSLGGLAWPQLMCCALDLLSANACESCVWLSLLEEPEMAWRPGGERGIL
jgi:hypothetical protein